MAIYKEDIVDINLNKGNLHRKFLPYSIGSKDDDANRFGIRAFRDGVPEDLSGVSCQGIFTNAEGTNIALTSYGTVSGNVAYITLPPACYDVVGQFCLSIKLVGGGVTGTMRIVDGMVDNTHTTGAVAPTSSVPTYQEVIAQYDAMVAATSAANTAIAEDFVAANAYPAGKYVINEGSLYRLTADHAANVTWPNTSKTAVKIGNDVFDLKSALSETENHALGYISLAWEQGNINSSGNASSAKWIRTPGYYAFATSDALGYHIASGYSAMVYGYGSDSSYKGGLGTITGDGLFTITTANVAKIRLKVSRSDSGNIVPAEGYQNVVVWKHGEGYAYDYANAVAKDDKITFYWEQGTLSSSGESSSNNLIRTKGYLGTGMIGAIRAVKDDTTYNLRLFEYKQDLSYNTYKVLKNGKTVWLHPDTAFIRLRASLVAETAMTPADGANYAVHVASGRLPYITPQMFGATGDGTTDDTAAFQAAVSYGRDVCVPFANHEKYLISDMVTISGSQCKRMYGDGGQNGYIWYDVQSANPSSDFHDLRSRSLFRITTTQAFSFDNINVRAKTAKIGNKTKRVGGFLRANDDTCDYDIKIRNCNISKFYRFVAFKGRGFTVENSAITSMQTLGAFSWEDEKDTNKNHPAEMDQRAIIFKGNRLHSIQSGGIVIKSGHAYGLVFTDNVMDVGRKYLIIAYDEAWNWTIANNTLLGYVDAMPVIEFKSGAKNLIIQGNQFISDSYFWISTPGNPTNWIQSAGDVIGSNISGNIFKNAADSILHFKGLVASSISNNIMTNPGHVIGGTEPDTGDGDEDDSGDNPYVEPDYDIDDDVEDDDEETPDGETETGVGCIYIEEYIQRSTIIGNVVTYDSGTSGEVLVLGTGATQTGNVITNNVG